MLFITLNILQIVVFLVAHYLGKDLHPFWLLVSTSVIVILRRHYLNMRPLLWDWRPSEIKRYFTQP